MKTKGKIKLKKLSKEKIQEPSFPPEGKLYANVTRDLKQPLSEKDFKLGLETNYEQMTSFINERKQSKPDYLFIDTTFPPTQKVLVKNDTVGGIFWRRPHQMVENPTMIADRGKRFDTIQGELGDCYFLSSCAAIAMQQHLIDKIIPPGQSLQKDDPDYTGLLRFCFWRFGQWVEVVVDDLLPTRNGEHSIYARSSNPTEFWVSFLEKAYAKLHGSYEAMAGGFNSNSLIDMTGGITIHYNLTKISKEDKDKMFKRIAKSVRHRSLICCGVEEYFNPITTTQGDNEVTGLVIARSSAVTGATKVRLLNGEFELLIRVRNPWDEDMTDWKLTWSHKPNLVKKASNYIMSRLRRKIIHQGEWWMTYDEFCAMYKHVTICCMGPELKADGTPFTKRFCLSTVRGAWKQGKNAGGCANNIELYAKNPQYLLRLTEADDLKTVPGGFPPNQCFIQIGLTQEYRRLEESKELPTVEIHLRLYKIKYHTTRKLSAKFLASAANVQLQKKTYQQQRQIDLIGSCGPGYYVIIPSTFYADTCTGFLLRVFTERDVLIKELY